MTKIIYYIATSIDGYIAGPNEDISLFIQDGPGVKDYFSELTNYQTVIMGRKTYEFGLKFGLIAGQPAYPHMTNYVFTNRNNLKSESDKLIIKKPDVKVIKQIKSESTTDIYLCGGGTFAGWLLENNLIDVVKIKLNPILLGKGVRIFGSPAISKKLSLLERKAYDDGLEVLTYTID